MAGRMQRLDRDPLADLQRFPMGWCLGDGVTVTATEYFQLPELLELSHSQHEYLSRRSKGELLSRYSLRHGPNDFNHVVSRTILNIRSP